MGAHTGDSGRRVAKVSPPRPVEVFPRERLFRQLDEASRRPLVWIAGPPGAGKTTLVTSYLEARRAALLWYRLDATDADVGSFFHYLALAAPSAVEHEPRELSRLRPEHRFDLEAFSRRFFEALCEASSTPLTLVFDNYHAVPADASLHDILRWGLEQLPEACRFIFISRGEPPNSLARFESERALSFIGPKDLPLTLNEAEGIARLWPGWEQRRPRVPAMLEQSEGWTAGFILMLENETSGSAVAADIDSMTQDSLFRYFAGEIFDQLDAPVRKILMQTALLPRITDATARALTGENRAGEIIARIHKRNYFTERVGGPPPEYQFHPLFREFLLAEADKELGPERVTELRGRAARVSLDAGRYEEAAELFESCGEWRALAGLCRQLAPELLEQGRNDTLARWLSALPDEIKRADPWIKYWLGQCILAFDPVQAHGLFQSAYDAFTDADDKTGWLAAWAGVVDAITYRWDTFQEMDPWIEAMDRFEEEVDQCSSPPVKARSALSMFSALMFRQPGHPRIHEWGDRALASAEETGDPELQLRAIECVCHFLMWFGELARAGQLLRRSEQLLEEHPVATIVRLGNLLQRSIHGWHVGEFERALTEVETGLELASREGIRILDIRLLAQGVYACAGAGDLDRARDYLARLAPLLGTRFSLDVGHYHLQSGWLELLAGSLETAFKHAQLAHEQAETAGTPFPIALSGYNFARVALASGDPALARRLLDKASAIAEAMRSGILQAQCGLMAAELARGTGEHKQCLEALRRALAIMRSNGYVMFAGWDPAMVARLCDIALAHGIEPGFTRELIRRRGLASPEAGEAGPEWPWPLRVRTLGGFRVKVNGEAISFSGKAQRRPVDLVRSLIALGAREVDERALADILWPDAEGDAALQSLATTLHRTRKLLAVADAVVRSQGRLSLNPACTWVDSVAFEAALDQAEVVRREGGEPARIRRWLETGLRYYEGPFLPDDVDTSWVIPLRERLETRFGRAVEQLAVAYVQSGQLDDAMTWYEYGIDRAPLLEILHQGLIRAYLESGRIAAATAAYRRCESVFAQTLGIEPAPDTRALVAEHLTAQQDTRLGTA